MMSTACSIGMLILCQAVGGLSEMFDNTVKDFGAVPRGSVTVHRFVLKNTTTTPIVATGVRTSCRCATPTLENTRALPGEEIVVAVRYDTRTFTGPRAMSIHVSFNRPRTETVTLRVSGVSRPDVTFNPALADLGNVSQSRTATRTVRIAYAGGSDWRIEKALPSPWVTASVSEAYRSAGQVGYDVKVTLKPGAPVGRIGEAVQLVTNDPRGPVLRLHVAGAVEAPLVASPSLLQLGELKVGEKAVKRIILRGKQPFTIKAVGGQSDSIRVMMTEGAKRTHILQVEFEAKPTGKVVEDLLVHTDLRDVEPLSVKVAGYVKK